MKTYDHSDPGPGPVREHPWTGSTNDPNVRCLDFRKCPELIRTSLEDFRPWSSWPAVETFYRLLEWLNGDDSVLESNDCELTGPHANETPQFEKTLEVTGRLMILWRELPLNLSLPRTEWLRTAIHHALNRSDVEFEWGAVGITLFRTKYVTLNVPDDQQLGYQLMLSFWCWGDTVEEAMTSLDRTFQNMGRALREVVREAATPR